MVGLPSSLHCLPRPSLDLARLTRVRGVVITALDPDPE